MATKIYIPTAIVLFLLAGSAWSAVDSMGCTTAEECATGWQVTTPSYLMGAWVTPDVANLQVDSGWVGIGDDYDDYDSALIVIYDNSSKTPNNLLAVSDTAIVSVDANCEMLPVEFAQESIPQNDSIWIGIFMFGLADRADIGLSGSSGADIYYSLDHSTIDDPWDTDSDTYDGNFYKPSVRIFLSESGAEPEAGQTGRRRKIIIGQ